MARSKPTKLQANIARLLGASLIATIVAMAVVNLVLVGEVFFSLQIGKLLQQDPGLQQDKYAGSSAIFAAANNQKFSSADSVAIGFSSDQDASKEAELMFFRTSYWFYPAKVFVAKSMDSVFNLKTNYILLIGENDVAVPANYTLVAKTSDAKARLYRSQNER